MTIKNSLYSSTILALVFCAIPALAETGHCNYRLYSKALDRTVRVCQIINSLEQCGELLPREYDRTRAHSVGNKGREVTLEKGECSLEAVVGICVLPHSKLYFYEGDTGHLAAGCDLMKGVWDVKRF